MCAHHVEGVTIGTRGRGEEEIVLMHVKSYTRTWKYMEKINIWRRVANTFRNVISELSTVLFVREVLYSSVQCLSLYIGF